MSTQHNRLGKGLSAIIAPRHVLQDQLRTQPEPGAAASDSVVRFIPVDQISSNPRQPRTTFPESEIAELARSIKSSGVLQPLIARPLPAGRFELVAGERRLRAARLAGLTSVPAVVRDFTDAESLEIALVENIQREDLNALDRARAYRLYMEAFNATPEQVADRLSQSRANVVNYLRMLNLPTEIQRMVETGELAMGQARALLAVDDPDRQLRLARLAARRNLSVRQVEQLVARPASEPAEPDPQRVSATSHLLDVARTLSSAVGLKVTLLPGRKRNSGRVVIHYENLDDFDRIASLLGARIPAE